MRRKRLNTILLVLLLLILAPALLYTGYEFSRLSKSEEQLSRVYEQQLETVLFSVNQYATDITGGWINTFERTLASSSSSHAAIAEVPTEIGARETIRGLALLDSSITMRAFFSPVDEETGTDALRTGLQDSLETHREKLDRLLRYKTEDYRKIEPFLVQIGDSIRVLALVAVLSFDRGQHFFGVLCLDQEDFIQRVLGPKFRAIASEDLLLFCRDKRTGNIVVSTADLENMVREDTQSRRLWLFPDYEIGIRLRGTTIEELAAERFMQTGVLFIAVDILLIIGAIIVFRNIRREVELAQLKSDFVSNVSHELKTPLALIRMFAETLEMKRVPNEEKKQEYYSIIVQETERLTRLINNILTFSRIESGRKEYHMRRTDLNTIVEKVMSIYGFHLEHREFSSEIHLDDRPVIVHADEEAVAEALINLIDNAMKYSDEQRHVAIRTGAREGQCFIEVEDHGIGIDPRHQKRIFEKFYRVSEGLVHTAKGSGLGLSLVQAIATAHGGHVQLESTPGRGSRFRLCFPVFKSDSQHSNG